MVSMQVEENSPSPQPAPTPQCVGREFCRQYYTLLAEAPRYVHRFYSNESIFVHGSDTEEVIGQSAIQNKIRDMSFEECRTRIRALDSHETLGKGVVVQVVGEISVNGGPMRRFVQTFVLASQSEKKYYVHNDIFRYEDELYTEELPHENGAPADPDAEKVTVEQRPPPAMFNGDTHYQDDTEKPRFIIAQNIVQQVPPSAVTAPAPDHQLQPQLVPSSGFSTAVASVGTIPVVQTQAGDGVAGYAWTSDGTGVSAVHTTSAASNAQHAASPIPTEYVHQALPQRQPQSHQTPAVPNMQASLDAPPEPSSTTASITPLEQPQAPPRPQSSDKPSPVPSEEREESVDTGPADETWASRVKQKGARGSNFNNASQQQQQPVHSTQGPGTSAPATLSPTAGSAPQGGGNTQAELTNRQGQPHNVHNSSRQQHPFQPRAQRYPHPYGPISQDVRLSAAPSSHQISFRPNHQTGPVETLPIEQQVYVKSVPNDATESSLKECIESAGYTGIAEVRIRKKPGPQPFSYAFVAFNSVEPAQKLIENRVVSYHNTELFVDVKRPMGSGGGNFSHGGSRPYPGSMPAGGGMGRGGHAMRGGVSQRGGMPPNRPMGQGPGGYGNGGGRGSRTFVSSAGRQGMPQQQQQQQHHQ